PVVRALARAEQAQLRQDVGTALFLVAHVLRVELTQMAESAAACQAASAALPVLTPLPLPWDVFPIVITDRAGAALELNQRAAACRVSEPPPQALLFQRAGLLRQLGRDGEADECLTRAKATIPRDARDYYQAACQAVAEGCFKEALSLAEQVTRRA